MGTRMVPSYARLFMKYFEHDLLDIVPKKLRIWFIFVDDIFLIYRYGKKELDRFMTIINCYYPTI